MAEYDAVIRYCTLHIYSYNRINLLQLLAADELKYGSRKNAPNWNMLANLVNIPTTFREYAEKIIEDEKNKIKNENMIFNVLAKIYGKTSYNYSKILHLLVADEERHGSREKSLHWKMLNHLKYDEAAFQNYANELISQHSPHISIRKDELLF